MNTCFKSWATSAFMVGLVVGPSLGGVLYQWGGFSAPFLVVGCFFAVVTVVLFFLMPHKGRLLMETLSVMD